MKGRREVAALTKNRGRRPGNPFVCGVDFAFRCCKIRKIIPFLCATKGVFFMTDRPKRNLKNKLFPDLSVKDICILGLILSITVLLAVFGTFRIGDAVKIPTKFISVFVAAATFGPVWGGICGALGDLLNAIIAPVGPWLPQITLIEFLSGFIYGLFFAKREYSANDFVVAAILCAFAQLFVDMVLTTAILTFWTKYYSSFTFAFLFRLPAGLVKMALQIAVIIPCRGLVERIKLMTYGR